MGVVIPGVFWVERAVAAASAIVESLLGQGQRAIEVAHAHRGAVGVTGGATRHRHDRVPLHGGARHIKRGDVALEVGGRGELSDRTGARGYC